MVMNMYEESEVMKCYLYVLHKSLLKLLDEALEIFCMPMLFSADLESDS